MKSLGQETGFVISDISLKAHTQWGPWNASNKAIFRIRRFCYNEGLLSLASEQVWYLLYGLTACKRSRFVPIGVLVKAASWATGLGMVKKELDYLNAPLMSVYTACNLRSVLKIFFFLLSPVVKFLSLFFSSCYFKLLLRVKLVNWTYTAWFFTTLTSFVSGASDYRGRSSGKRASRCSLSGLECVVTNMLTP